MRAVSSRPPHKSGLVMIYLALMVLTLLVFFSLGGFLLVSQKNQLQREFLQQALHAQQNLQKTFTTNEAILDGFMAYIHAAPAGAQGMREYVRSILQKYPDIYMFQLVRQVEAEKLRAFEQEQSLAGKPFAVWYFDGEVRYAHAQHSPGFIYFPVVFAEPVFDSEISILGLDVQSITFVHDALQESASRANTSLSSTFELFEGDYAQVIIKPALGGGQANTGAYYGLLVIKTKALLNSLTELDGRYALSLRDAGQETIISREAEALSGSRIPLEFTYQGDMQVNNKHMQLRIQRTLTLQEFHYWLVIVLLIIGWLVVVALLFVMRAHLMAERLKERENTNLQRRANYDQLTGLANRHYFQSQVELAMAVARRRETKIAFMYIDLNDFKAINDQHGHAIGDKVLIKFAEMIFAVIRGEDIAARLGGDEFVIMLNNIRNIHDTQRVLLELRALCALVQDIAGHRVKIKPSIGTVLFPDQGESLNELLQVADVAMYEDKNQHKRI